MSGRAATISMSSRFLPPDRAARIRPVSWVPITHADARGNEPPKETTSTGPDLESIREQAYRAGFAEGQRAAEKQAAASMEPLVGRLTATINSLVTLRSTLRRQAEADLVKLAFAIARKVLRRELTVDPTAIQGLLKAALEKLQTQEISRIYVHADQRAAIQEWVSRASPFHQIEVRSDAKLKPWDVRFETDHGCLDASVDTQLVEIERGFADRLRGGA